MKLNREAKATLIERIKQAVSSAGSTVFVNFHGLNVAEMSRLRADLRRAGSTLLVAKKTLIRRALAAAGVTGDAPDLPGEVALAHGADPLLPAKAVYRFGEAQDKERPKPEILGGVYEGGFSSAAAMTALALVPSREELHGMLANLLAAPITGLARALQAVAEAKN